MEFHAPDPRVLWRTVLPKRACLSLTTLRGRECGVLTLRDPSPGRQRSSRSGGGGAGGMAFTVDRRASRGAGQWPAGTLRPPPGHLLSIAVKGKPNKTKPNGRTGLRTGERENASQQSQPTPQQDPGTPGPSLQALQGRAYVQGAGGVTHGPPQGPRGCRTGWPSGAAGPAWTGRAGTAAGSVR